MFIDLRSIFTLGQATLRSKRGVRCCFQCLALVLCVATDSFATTQSELARVLQGSGWPPAAADRVASCQAAIQTQIEFANPPLAKQRLDHLKQLAKYPVATRLLLRHPDLTGFLLGADAPKRTAEILAGVADVAPAKNALLFYAADITQVVSALGNHRNTLLRLPGNGQGFDRIPVELFIGTTSEDVQYREFIDELLRWTRGNASRRVAVVGSLNRCSDATRQVFAKTPKVAMDAAWKWMKFCDDHPDRGEWMSGQSFEVDELLRFFMLPQSIEMADRAQAGAAVLFLRSNLPTELTEVLPSIVVKSDQPMLDAIVVLRDERGLVPLLNRRSLDPATLKAALMQSERDLTSLNRWMQKTDNAIRREVGTSDLGLWENVPFVEVTVKIIDGRELTAIDGVLVVVDVASLVFPLAKGGTVGLRAAGSVVRNDVTEIALKSYGKAMAKKTAKMSVKELQQSLPDVFEAAAKKAMMTRLKKGGLDVTALTRRMYEQVGGRSQTFRKFTALDSRVFMRSDRVVVLYPHHTMAGLVIRDVIEGESAILALTGAAQATEEQRQAVSEIASRQTQRISETTKEQRQAAAERLNSIWVACNEPGGVAEAILSSDR